MSIFKRVFPEDNLDEKNIENLFIEELKPFFSFKIKNHYNNDDQHKT